MLILLPIFSFGLFKHSGPRDDNKAVAATVSEEFVPIKGAGMGWTFRERYLF